MTTVTEPPGWGDAGSIRHAEAIGHGVWLDEHRDPTPVDDLEVHHDPVHTAALDALLDAAFQPERCFTPHCVRPEHPSWEQHIDAEGHGWFPGEAPR